MQTRWHDGRIAPVRRPAPWIHTPWFGAGYSLSTAEADLPGDPISDLPRERRDREAFLVAGYRLLGDRGFEGLTVAALCNRVGTTKGSFYHHFEDLPALVDALTARWQSQFVHVFSIIDAEPDPCCRFELGANVSFAVMNPGSAALRVGAINNPDVSAAMTVPHRVAMTTAATGLAEYLEDEDSGRVLAAMVLAMTVGTQHRARPLELERWMCLLTEHYNRMGVANELRMRGGRPQMQVLRSGRGTPVSTEPGSVANDVLLQMAAPVPLALASNQREQYFQAAWELLALYGSDAVTSRALAQRLGLTRGSFHHHFGSTFAFEQALAEHWERAEADHLARRLAERNPWRRLDLLLADLLVGPEPAEFAWRAWAHTNPFAGAAVQRIDHQFEAGLASTLTRLTGDRVAGHTAELTLAFRLGLHRWYPPFDARFVARAAIEWARRILRVDCELELTSGRPTLKFGPL